MRFMNENGFLNIYMIMLSTLLQPDANNYSDELMSLENQ